MDILQAIQILVVDLGSQYTQVIGRTLAEIGYRSMILPPQKAEAWLKTNKPKAIILSGGSASVHDEGAPLPPKEILTMGVPILGICYGMQWLANELGGEVVAHEGKKEYGKVNVFFVPNVSPLSKGLDRESEVWASHGDSVDHLPFGFEMIAMSEETRGIAGMADLKRKIWGLQFHPEVTHTKGGEQILKNFLDLSGCETDLVSKDAIKEIQDELLREIGPTKKAIIGLSGGVDSTFLSAAAQKVLGKRLLAVFIDHGGMRENELREVRAHAKAAGVQLLIVRAAKRFKNAIGQTENAEKVRKIFKRIYRQILMEVVRDFGADFILQGSLATDIIESGAIGEAAKIKSHHNIGLKFGKLIQLHPLRHLFKYEVRVLAEEIGLPKSVFDRQPFPGPGLYLRVLGAPITFHRLKILREADTKIKAILQRHGLYDQISQVVVSLLCTRMVGIKGDGRVYGYSIILRGLHTQDFMTGKGFYPPEEVFKEMEKAVTQHPEIVALLLNPTDKPPCTTEPK